MNFIKNNLGYIIGFFTIPTIKLIIKMFQCTIKSTKHKHITKNVNRKEMLNMFFRKNKELQSLVNSSRKSLKDAEEKITERNKLIKHLLEEKEELKARNTDLENNIEFLFNNLSKQKRELVRPTNQN